MDTKEFSTVEAAFEIALHAGFPSPAASDFLSVLKRHYPKRRDCKTVLDLLSGSPPDKAKISSTDRLFAASIAALRQSDSSSRAATIPGWKIREIGPELDFLAASCFLPDLTPIQLVNLLLLRRILPSKPAAVVVTMRDEGLYLLEWVAFYRAIGIPDIFIYTNDNVDGSDDLLTALAEGGAIRLLRNRVREGVNPQRKAYQHALHLLQELRDYRWVLFLDADEYLVPAQRYDYRLQYFIREVEDRLHNRLPGAILFPWDWRLSDRCFGKTAGLLFERYPHSIRHFGVKSLTRLNAALGMCEVHLPTLENGARLVDSALLPVEAEIAWGQQIQSDDGGSIAHFWGKSFEEFAIKKRRGDQLTLEHNPLLRDFSQYFEWTASRSAATFHPAPSVLLERTYRCIEQLKSLPGVAEAVEMVLARFLELSRMIDKEMDLRAIYSEMHASIHPLLGPPADNGGR